MSDVQVTVTLPPAPEGKEWYEIFYGDTGRPDYYQIGWALRPIAPAYVYPKVRREDAEKYVEWYNGSHRPFMNIVAAMREALEAKPERGFDRLRRDHPEIVQEGFDAARRGEGDLPETIGVGTKPEPVCGKLRFRGEPVSEADKCQLPANHEGPHA